TRSYGDWSSDVCSSDLADHRRALADPAQRFAQVAAAAHERHLERVLVHVMFLVRRRQHLALVDEVDAERLEHLRFRGVADAALRSEERRVGKGWRWVGL